MKVAYVTTWDANEVFRASGLPYFIAKALEKQGIELIRLQAYPSYSDPRMFIKRIFYRLFKLGKYRADLDPATQRHLAKDLSARLEKLEFDAVFSPTTATLAYLRTNKPVIFYTDAAFGALVDYYAYFTNMCSETLGSGNDAEQDVLTRCAAAIYSSDWAKETALKHYRVAYEKIHVVPYGANLECARTETDIERMVGLRRFAPCRLLFFGTEWERKGGDYAVKVAEILNQRGLSTELIVLGCAPPSPIPDFVKVQGYISKQTPEGRSQIDDLIQQAHFLVFPSRVETFGLVAPEANSFGVPVLASNVGGFPTVINNGQNGFAYSLDHFVESAVAMVEHHAANPAVYLDLAKASFREFRNRLNWDVAGKQIRDLLEKVIAHDGQNKGRKHA